jgi:hypothetical protein
MRGRQRVLAGGRPDAGGLQRRARVAAPQACLWHAADGPIMSVVPSLSLRRDVGIVTEEGPMKFGLLFRPQDPPEAANIVGRWQEILAAAKVAEEVGFDGLFVPEHHMMPDGYLPSPWAALGGAGRDHRARRERHDDPPAAVRAPDPRGRARAMVDVISNGRLRLGCPPAGGQRAALPPRASAARGSSATRAPSCSSRTRSA